MADAARETGTYLDRIVATRRARIAEELRDVGGEPRNERVEALPGPPVDFAMRLRGSRTRVPVGLLRVIAEVKRASPSKGVFDADLDAARQAVRYAEAGAAAVSVLTEPDHFAGSAADLAAARAAFGDDPERPALLRKDFIFDARQVVESRELGADAVLLIAALLEAPALRSLLDLTHGLGLQALVEVHDEAEMVAAADAGARVLGVNNRDLRTFEEDLGTFERLAPAAPEGVVLVAESAIGTYEDASRMAAAGAQAVLVGEALVRSGDIERSMRELMLVTDDAPTEAPPGVTS
jgi:indole-3-glycerol phosphate synthase